MTAGDTLAARLGMLQNNGHAWMDAPTQVTLAAAPNSNNDMMNIADGLKSAVSSTWDGFSHFYDDQVLHKAPTASLALTRYLSSAIGPVPVRDTDVAHMQQTLKDQGFDVEVTGQWTAGDNAALSQHAQAQVDRHLAGDRPGATTVGSFLRGFVHYLTPSGAGDALIGFVKSIPGDVRQLAADSIGLGGMALRGVAENVMHPGDFGGNLQRARQEGRREDLWVQQHLWNHNITAADIQSQTTGKAIIGKFLDDIGTALLFTGVGRVGANSLKAGLDLARFPTKVTLEDAVRGPGAVARSLTRTPEVGKYAGRRVASPAGRAVTGSVLGGAAGGVNADVHDSSIGMGIAEGALLGAAGGAVLPRRAFENLPVLNHTGPILGRLADADGLYYKARTRLAIPYKYNAVSQAGKIMGQAQLGGLEVGAVTAVDNALGQQNSSLAGQVNNTHVLDAVRDATAFSLGVPGHGPHVRANLDDLMFFLHAPMTGADRLSAKTADEADRVTNAAVRVQGGPGGPLEQFQRGLQAAEGGRAPSYDQLVKLAGSPQRLAEWINVKTRFYAAYHEVELRMGDLRVHDQLPESDKDRLLLRDQMASTILHDPAQLDRATEALLNGNQHYIETQIKQEIGQSFRNPKEYLRHELGDYMDAVEHVRVLQRDMTGLIIPLTAGALDDARADAQFMHQTDVSSGHRLMRRDVADANLDPSVRPQGTYYSLMEHPGFESPHAPEDVVGPGVDPATVTDFHAHGTRDGVLELQQQTLQHARFDGISKGFEGNADTGVSALKTLLPPHEFERLRTMSKTELLAELKQRAPKFDWSQVQKHQDAYDLLSAYGGVVARERGFKAMLLRDPHDPNFHEYVALHPSAVRAAAPVPSIQPTMRWLRENNPAATANPANLGIARTDTLSATHARSILDGFRKRLDANPADTLQIRAELEDWAFHNFALDAPKLSVFKTTDRLLDNLYAHTDLLHGDVHVADDAPAWMHEAVASLAAKDYKPVWGTDIGHLPAGTFPMTDLGKPLALRKRAAGVLALNPERYSQIDHAVDLDLRVKQRISDLVDSGKIAGLPPHWTVGTVLSWLRNDKNLARQLPWPERVAFALSPHGQDIRLLADTYDSELSIAERLAHAEGAIKNEIANSLGLRNLSRKDVQRVLTTPDEVTGVPLMSAKDANEIYKAITLAYGDKKTYMMGLGHLEDVARALPMHVSNWRIASKVPLAMLDLPNELARLRDRWRFQLSPMFTARRIAKTNVKMQLDGVPPALNPTTHMIESGTFDAAHKTLDRVMGTGQDANRWLDENDKYLHSHDIWGGYNPRRFEAYYAHQKELQGATDDEIRAGLIRTFNYGNRHGEGRSALERSANTIFFPFSFEKTLLRNTGAYLLDHPGQALALSNGLDLYRQFNTEHEDGSNPLAASFWKQHAPVLMEAYRLNAFAHGISPGELGGINAPVLNFFMPQSWAANANSNSTLKRFAPVVGDFQRIFLGKNGNPGEISDQYHIVRQASANVWSIIQQQPHGPLNPMPSTKTHGQQIQDAIDLRTKLLADGQIAKIVTYNEHTGSNVGSKYTWPTTDNVPKELRGRPITKSSVGELVHHIYPAYDPNKGAMISQANKAAVESKVASLAGTAQYADWNDFVTKAQTAITHLNGDDYPAAQAVAVQQAFRDRAADLAQSDPGFLSFYVRHFQHAFGPIQRISG